MSSAKHATPLAVCNSKRHRRNVPKAAFDTLDPLSSWASLHEDLVRLIAWRVLDNDLLDYVRFRAVCPTWRSSTKCPGGHGIIDPRFHPRRWMMLPEGHGIYPGHGKLSGYIRFFNLSSGTFVRVKLPIFKDHCILDSVDGILLLQRDQDTAIRLLHPFTGDIVDLPQLATLLPFVIGLPGACHEAGKWFYLRNDLSTCISVNADGVITVMMWLSYVTRMAFATPGDHQWRLSPWMFRTSYNALAFRGKMYMMNQYLCDGEAYIYQIEPSQQEMDSGSFSVPPPKLIATFPINACYYYLVECNSEILVSASGRNQPSQFTVYRLADLIMERIVPVTSIGGNALFLYSGRTLSVNSKALPTLVEDTVVALADKPYLLQYHLNTGTCSQAADGTPGNYSVPNPCTIIYHIITCCLRDQWNKGHLFGQCKRKSTWRVKAKCRAGA